jgi:hypothetical protein
MIDIQIFMTDSNANSVEGRSIPAGDDGHSLAELEENTIMSALCRLDPHTRDRYT